MGDQDLEPRPSLPEPDILAPGAPQRQVGAGLQLGPRDQAGPAELGDLLGIGQIRLLATELPGLADPEGRQRIDHHVLLAPSPEHVGDSLPHVPGRLEGEHTGRPGGAEGGGGGAPEQFREPRPRMWNPEPGQPLTRSGQHDGLVLGACQVQADDHIITPKAASIVRHMGPSFVSGWTREGITRTRRRCRLPLSHTLILESGRLRHGDGTKKGGDRCPSGLKLAVPYPLSIFLGQLNWTRQPPEERRAEANSYVGSGSITQTDASALVDFTKYATLDPTIPPPMIATSHLDECAFTR